MNEDAMPPEPDLQKKAASTAPVAPAALIAPITPDAVPTTSQPQPLSPHAKRYRELTGGDPDPDRPKRDPFLWRRTPQSSPFATPTGADGKPVPFEDHLSAPSAAQRSSGAGARRGPGEPVVPPAWPPPPPPAADRFASALQREREDFYAAYDRGLAYMQAKATAGSSVRGPVTAVAVLPPPAQQPPPQVQVQVPAAQAQSHAPHAEPRDVGPGLPPLYPSEPVDFRTVRELVAYERPPDLNLMGDLHLHRGGVMLLAGAPGTGKSRALCGLALAGALGPGASWFSLPVHTRFRTLILQYENSAERLRGEWRDIVSQQSAAAAARSLRHPDPLAAELRERQLLEGHAPPQGITDAGDFDAWVRISLPPAQGFRLGNRAFLDAFRRLVQQFRPHVIGLDPWVRVSEGSSLTGCQRVFDFLAEALPSGAERPALVIVAHTRRPRVEARRSGRHLLHQISGPPMLIAAARSVFVMEHASDAMDENRVVLTCCKNNDGQPGQRAAWVRQNGFFAPVSGAFDWKAFDGVEQREAPASRLLLEHVRAVFEGETAPLRMPEAVYRLMEIAGVGRTTAYGALSGGGEFGKVLVRKEGRVSLRESSVES